VRSINRHFAIAAKETTRRQWQRSGLEEQPIDQWSPTDDCPQTGMLWRLAVDYCNWLSEQEGIPADQWCYEKDSETDNPYVMIKPAPGFLNRIGYRLPTEAEWEYACRAGTVTARYYGFSNNLLNEYAWHMENSQDRMCPVGTKKPNAIGLFDMLGNTAEWCQDRWSADAYPKDGGEVGDDHHDSEKPLDPGWPRCVRGFAFRNEAKQLRCAARNFLALNNFQYFVGFRVARTLPPTAETIRLR
jgi:formylglycine-generating enzyme required for sulfatase activity